MQKIFMETHYKSGGKIENHPNSKCFYNKYFILLIEEPSNIDAFQLNKKVIHSNFFPLNSLINTFLFSDF